MSSKDPNEITTQDNGSDVIDTTGMSEGKREALELTEASREGLWEYPTFAGALFMGQFPWKLVKGRFVGVQPVWLCQSIRAYLEKQNICSLVYSFL